MNPNSKKGKAKKALAKNPPVPLGKVYEVKHNGKHLGYSATPPPTKTEISLYALSFRPNPHKKFKIKGKPKRADIF